MFERKLILRSDDHDSVAGMSVSINFISLLNSNSSSRIYMGHLLVTIRAK